MCGRYYIEIDDVELQNIGGEITRIAQSFDSSVAVKTHGEIFPTDIVPVQTGPDKFVPMKWGFTGYNKKPIINARSETALQKPTFRKPMAGQRCLIPASGYYEWLREGKLRTKYQIMIPGSRIYFAGCYRQEPDCPYQYFVIITRDATDGLENIHDRMPVIIPRESADAWLNVSPDMSAAITELEYRIA